LPAYSKAQTINCVNSVLPKKVSNLKTHINTSTFTSSSAIILDNFSSTYDSYRIILRCISDNAGKDKRLAFRWRVSGSSISTSNYQYIGIKHRGSTTSSISGASATNGGLGWVSNNNTIIFADVIISDTAAAQNQLVSNFAWGTDSVAFDWGNYGNIHTGNFGRATGIEILTTAGEITGFVSVYGYVKA
jgi:hypothetical protein